MVQAEHMRSMLTAIDKLGGTIGACERIQGTPLPVV
jgi:predicted membrane chloride channel (bestrophin family)